jgi:CubicO group peptidase (beta-lactamase class C family)
MQSFQTRPPVRPMLVIDLLRHTSGLTYGFHQKANVDAAYRQLKIGGVGTECTLEEMIEKLATLLEFSPGEAWNYSVSTDVLGYIVGKVSGTPFEVFLKKRIFDPLGMVDTAFHVPEDKASRLCSCYSVGQFGAKIVSAHEPTLQDDSQISLFLKPPTFVSGGGGLVSTATGYMRFARMRFRVVSSMGCVCWGPMTLSLMATNHLPGGLPRLACPARRSARPPMKGSVLDLALLPPLRLRSR